MQRTVTKKSEKGFSLIELLIAIVILTIATLGLLQALSHYIQINMDNAMRNEAMRITEERMEQIRGLKFADTPDDELVPDDGSSVPNSAQLPTTVSRSIRKLTIPYTVRTTISRLSFRSDGVTPNSKAIQVLVTWRSKGTTGTQHQHSAATVITREW